MCKHQSLSKIIASLFFLASIPLALQAEIVTDGSLGASASLAGPDYAIVQNLGATVGNNLFHSFSSFNLNQSESANFSADANIQNIISRITGGDASLINGKIHSGLVGTDLFFLNPAGIVFGEHASLDLGGSFHVSTGDYIGFADGAKFYAQPLAGEVLSTSSPASFGFLDQSHEAIEFNGSQLKVKGGEVISILGGDVVIDNGAKIEALSGQINIAALQGEAELGLDFGQESNLDDMTKGSISIRNGSILEVSNLDELLGSGSIYIIGGSFLLETYSQINAVSDSAKDGQLISIKVDDLTISDSSSVFSLTLGPGNGTDIEIEVKNSLLINKGGEIPELAKDFQISGLVSSTEADGKAGDINVIAKNINLQDKASIDMATFASGDAGIITITADGAIHLGDNSRIFGDTRGSGKGGTIVIQAAELSLSNSSNIDVGSFASGDGGDIYINVSGNMALSDLGRIYSDTANSGNGGSTTIIASNLSLDGESSIDSSSNGVKILKNEQGQESLFYATQGTGKSGDINIEVSGSVVLSNQSTIYSNSLWEFGRNNGESGDAGAVLIKAGNNIELSGNSAINSESVNAGGGVLTLNAVNQVYLLDSVVTSSVEKGFGDGGDINTNNSNYVILNEGQIIAQAFQGSGGNIHIVTDSFVASENSVVDASSQLGIDGRVVIESPSIENDSNVVVLSTRYLDSRKWQQQPCASKAGNQGSRFVVVNRKGLPPLPDDMMAASFDSLVSEKETLSLKPTNKNNSQSQLKTLILASEKYQISCQNAL